MTKRTTTLIQRYCRDCQARFNTHDSATAPAADDPRTQINCTLPRIDRTDDYARERGITVSGHMAVLCPECSSPRTDPTKRKIHASASATACETVCAEATGSKCQCSCEGARHGISA